MLSVFVTRIIICVRLSSVFFLSFFLWESRITNKLKFKPHFTGK